MLPVTAISDLWIARRARAESGALAEIAGREPAAVITGASRGIGRAMAFRFARAGHHVVMIARGSEALTAAAEAVTRATGVRAVAISLDVTQPDSPHTLDAKLSEARFYADILVNNAGTGLSGDFAAQSDADIARLIDLNITAATRLMHHALRPMLRRARGGVLNVASLGGLVPGPYQAAYYASKAYLVSLTEAVSHEVRGRGVRVSVVAPGPVDTSFHRAMQAESALYRRVVPAQSADLIARSAYRGYTLGRTVIVPGVLPTIGAFGVKVLPHALSVPLVATLLRVAPGSSEKTID